MSDLSDAKEAYERMQQYEKRQESAWRKVNEKRALIDRLTAELRSEEDDARYYQDEYKSARNAFKAIMGD